MFRFFRLSLGLLIRFLRSRHSLLLENLALRQQLTALKRKHPKPRLGTIDRLFWVLARRFWPAWKRCLLIVTPETVVRWHRAGFRLYWNLISKLRKCGRKRISKQVRELIFRMAEENSTWGAPRIHGELLKLGFQISERTVSRWMKRVPRNLDPARRWLAFLRNHREAIASMDFFTVPTFTFGILYCFFVVAHDRRRILHCNVTRYPTALWIAQQLREAFPYDTKCKYLIYDRDAKFGSQVSEMVAWLNLKTVRTSFRSPWQKDYASHCTSWVRSGTTSLARRRWESLVPWAFRGGLSPGWSYR